MISLLAPSTTASPALASRPTVPVALPAGLASSFARYTRFLTLIAGLNGCGSAQDNRGEVESVPDETSVQAEAVEPAPVFQTTRTTDVQGTVISKRYGSYGGTPIVHADINILLEDGRSFIVKSNSEGRFLLEGVPAGTVEFIINAAEYEPVREEIVVGSSGLIRTVFELEHIPQIGAVTGWVSEAGTGQTITNAIVKLSDSLGRSISLTTDESGNFNITSVPRGVVRLRYKATGYITAVRTVEIKTGDDLQVKAELMKRPSVPNMSVKGSQLILKRPLQFKDNSSEVKMTESDFDFMMDELADYLLENKKGQTIAQLEIRGHTAEDFANAKRASKRRAELVQEALVLRGVDESRLLVNTYGAEHPLVPNTSEANRARNNRVDFVIKQSKPVQKKSSGSRREKWRRLL